jgi:glycosyltransferase involved in cell wall biosynthesis
MAVIPQFGVDPQFFAPPSQDPPRERFVVGFAGRLVPEKGPDLLLTAAARLKGVEILILGGGPMKEALEEQARKLDLTDRVSFEGNIPSTQMPAFYHRLDALVLPSRSRPNWVEQFGRVLIEAMACGVPVLGADSGEIPHVIGEAGLTFPEGDARALRARLEELALDSNLRQDLARRGRERVLAYYTQTQIAAETVAVYREMMAHSPGPNT